MCLLSVARRDYGVNPPTEADGAAVREPDPTPLEGYPNAGPARAARRRSARESASTWARRSTWRYYRWLSGRPVSLDRSLFNPPRGERRTTPRVVRMVLTESERLRVRSLIAAAQGCGSRWGAFRRLELSDLGATEYRLACQLKCGTRMCDECDAEIRRRESWRAEGPWRMFITLTLPWEVGTQSECWRAIHGFLTAFLREIRRAIADNPNWPVRFEWGDDRTRANQHDENADSWGGRNKFDYAWVLEPHRNGRPHVHLVTNADYINYSWLIGLWRRCTANSRSRLFGARVWQRDGICRYLAKYISKSHLSPDILGMMKGRRLWASTMPRPEKKPALWTKEPETEDDQAYASAEFPTDFAQAGGWKIEMAKRGSYVIFSRKVDESRASIQASIADYEDHFEGGRTNELLTDRQLTEIREWREANSDKSSWHDS